MKLLNNSEFIVWKILKFSVGIFSKRQKRLVLVATMYQSFLNILDLLGIFLFALLGVLVISGLTYTDKNSTLETLLRGLRIEESDLQVQVLTLSFLALTLLLLRSFLSILFFKRFNLFLARLSAQYVSFQLSKLLRSSLDVLQTRNTQEWFISLVKGSQTIIVRAFGSLIGVIVDFGLLLFIFIGLVIYSWQVATLIAFYFCAIALIVYLISNSRIKRFSEQELAWESKSNTAILDLLAVFREIKVNGDIEEYLKTIHRQKLSQSYVQAKLAFLPIINKYLYEGALVSSTLIFSGLMFFLFDVQKAFGAITLFFAASTRIMPTLMRIQTQMATISSSTALMDLVLETTSDLHQRETNLSYSDMNSVTKTQFSDIRELAIKKFSIFNQNLSLQDMNMKFVIGKTYAIVGKSGSGKSTLVDMILGLRDKSSGTISINDEELNGKEINVSKLFGIVPQEVYVMDASLRDNILLGRVDISDSRILQVMRVCNLSALLNDKNGLDQMLGSSGRQLSGGEKQRLGLVRALISEPKVLLLDEATSALDPESKDIFINSLFDSRDNRIIVMITHDVDLTSKFDVVYEVIDDSIRLKSGVEELELHKKNNI